MNLIGKANALHDIRYIRKHPEEFDRQLNRLGEAPIANQLIKIDSEQRRAIIDSETASAERNQLSRQAGIAKSQGNKEEFERLRIQVTALREKLVKLSALTEQKSAELKQLLLEIPNIPMPDVPDGIDESSNQELYVWGNKKTFEFKPLEHFEIPAVSNFLDFKSAATLAGSRFMVLHQPAARLHRALAQFMLDTHITEHGLQEIWVPTIVRDEIMLGTGQLPKFKDDSYRLENGNWLIPTSEVPLTNMVRDRLVTESILPLRYCAHTHCFRSEAGAAGKDTAGMLRQHQFEKVEMVSITTPDTSEAEQLHMRQCAEAILKALELPFRTIILCTGDMGFGARRTFDLEVWLPGQNAYREISSVSTCGDFQARRMNARYRPTGGGTPKYLHTLNGSGVAVGRAMIAILENGQQHDGSVMLPSVLHPYLGGMIRIDKDGNFTS